MAERRAPLQAPDKLNFLLSLVAFLLDRDRVTVAVTAEHFGVSPAQVREAVKLIAVSGVPGSAAAYLHGDLFDIDWDSFEEHDEIVLTNHVAIDDTPRWSAREASALIAGLQYLQTLPEFAAHGAIEPIMAKLSRGASSEPGQVAVGATQTDATLTRVREAVARGRQLEFDYRNGRGESERRRIDPLRLESLDADWYVRGWCHLREATRLFRIDRISSPVVIDEPVTGFGEGAELPEQLFESSGDDLAVTIEVAPSALVLLTDYLSDGTAVQEVGGRIRTTLRFAHFHGLKRLIASLGGAAEVTGPAEARAAVAEWAAAGTRRYEE